MSARLVIVGDSLLDRDLEGSVDRLCPDAPVPVVDGPTTHSRPGGAALAALLAARAGRDVTLITAVADDAAGRELKALLDAAGVRVIAFGLQGPTVEKIRVRADGRTLLRIDRGCGPVSGIDPVEGWRDAIGDSTVLVSDYGRGLSDQESVRDALATHAVSRSVVWDPHPRGGAPVRGCRLVTPNRIEAGLSRAAGINEASARGRELARRWHTESVAITLGAAGALIVTGLEVPVVVPAPRVASGDPCGAGDCFAVTVAGRLADGAGAADAVAAAVTAASGFVAAGGAASLSTGDGRAAENGDGFAAGGLERALQVISRARAEGARVVATGGCFDILHAGHIASLRAARSLGGCLVVCLNSDSSVRRLKGPSRPVVSERDRIEVLQALSCVDAVVVFDEDTPEAVLRALKPDVFVKGGDYELAAMPEAQLLRSWGGEAVLVPYVDGYSTTGLLEEVQRRAG